MSRELPKVGACHRCGEEGHVVRECPRPEITRKYVGADGREKEIYIPKETGAKALFSNSISSGINFSQYDDIPVKVEGKNPPTAVTSFAEAGLDKLILENVEKSGYTVPTPIQKHTIPAVLAGRDMMACAQTGSGKTA